MRFEVHGTRGRAGLGARAHERARALPALRRRRTRATRRSSPAPQHPDFAAFQPGAGVPMGYDDLRVLEAAQLPRRRARRRAARARAWRRCSPPRACSTRSSARPSQRRLGGGAVSAARRQRAAQLRRLRDDRRHRLRRARARAGARGDRRRRLRRHRPRPARLPRRGRRARASASPPTASRSSAASSRCASPSRGLRGGRRRRCTTRSTCSTPPARPARGPCCATPAAPSGSPTPAAAARTRRCGSTTRAGGTLAANVERAAEAARERGYEPVFHHHTSTYVEGMPEIERFLEDTDVALLLDSGHLLVAGGDPVTALRDWGERIGAVHIKDVRLDVLERRQGRARRHADRLAPRPVLRARAGRRRPRRLLRRADRARLRRLGRRRAGPRARRRRATSPAPRDEQVANREWLREHAGW